MELGMTKEKARKKKRREKGIRMAPVAKGGSCDRGKLPACWEVRLLAGRTVRTEGGFGAPDEKSTTCLQQLDWRETCTDGQRLRSALPVSDARLLGTGGGWAGKPGFQRSDPERGLGVGCGETG